MYLDRRQGHIWSVHSSNTQRCVVRARFTCLIVDSLAVGFNTQQHKPCLLPLNCPGLLLLPLLQSTTIYKQGNTLLAKQYTFKVQAVQPPTAPSSCSSTPSLLSQLVDSTTGNGNGSSGSRKTIARAKLDLAQFCSAQSTSSGAATEVQLPLQPQGLLVLSIKSVWLQHYDRAKAAQLLKQEPERGFGRPFGSASDLDTSTMSSMTGSAYGSCLSETDRDECECALILVSAA